MKKLILFITLIIVTFAQEVYFMPSNASKAHKKFIYLLTHAHSHIDMVIYTFTDRKIAKALKIAAAKGVKITIIADKKESKYKYSQIPKLAAIKKIKVYLLSGKRYKNGDRAKLHAKITIIDSKTLVIGSANYSYSAFFKNYEYLIIEKDKNLINKFENFYKTLKSKATPYRLSR